MVSSSEITFEKDIQVRSLKQLRTGHQINIQRDVFGSEERVKACIQFPFFVKLLISNTRQQYIILSVHFVPERLQGLQHDEPWASGKSNPVVEVSEQ